jgi:type II pantothenate kinase
MHVAIDFGISNTDIAVLNNNDIVFYSEPSKSEPLNSNYIKKILSEHNIQISDVSMLGVTGGKSSDLENEIEGIEIIKINEIDAIGLGAKKLYKLRDMFKAINSIIWEELLLAEGC